MKKIISVILFVIYYLGANSQASKFNNGEGYGSIRLKLNSNADLIDQNTADNATNSALISSNADSIDVLADSIISLSNSVNVLNDSIDSLRISIDNISSGGGITYDSLEVISRNDMGVRVDSTEPHTIYSKHSGYYVYNLTQNDTIVIEDDLGYNYAFYDTLKTTESVFTIEVSGNNAEQLVLTHNDTIININGTVDWNMITLIMCYRKPTRGNSIRSVLSCAYSYEFEK